MIIDLRNRILLFILPLNLTFVFTQDYSPKSSGKLSNIIIILFHTMNTMSKLIGFIIS